MRKDVSILNFRNLYRVRNFDLCDYLREKLENNFYLPCTIKKGVT